jgi:hypothetical protein
MNACDAHESIVPDVVIGALFRQIVFKVCCNAKVNSRPAVTLTRGMVFGSRAAADFCPKTANSTRDED